MDSYKIYGVCMGMLGACNEAYPSTIIVTTLDSLTTKRAVSARDMMNRCVALITESSNPLDFTEAVTLYYVKWQRSGEEAKPYQSDNILWPRETLLFVPLITTFFNRQTEDTILQNSEQLCKIATRNPAALQILRQYGQMLLKLLALRLEKGDTVSKATQDMLRYYHDQFSADSPNTYSTLICNSLRLLLEHGRAIQSVEDTFERTVYYTLFGAVFGLIPPGKMGRILPSYISQVQLLSSSSSTVESEDESEEPSALPSSRGPARPRVESEDEEVHPSVREAHSSSRDPRVSSRDPRVSSRDPRTSSRDPLLSTREAKEEAVAGSVRASVRTSMRGVEPLATPVLKLPEEAPSVRASSRRPSHL